MKKNKEINELKIELQYWEERTPNNNLIKSIKDKSVKSIKKKIGKMKIGKNENKN